MEANNERGIDLIGRLRFCPTLHRLNDFDGFAISRDDLAALLSSRTEAADLLEQKKDN